MAVEERDCTEGCADDGHAHKWQIEPHPRSGDFDTYVTDDDQEARRVFLEAAEAAWDDCEPGQTRTITIRHYSAVETKVIHVRTFTRVGAEMGMQTMCTCGAKMIDHIAQDHTGNACVCPTVNRLAD